MNESFAFQRPKAGIVPLTSLMDVLTILLVFLLVNFTSTPQKETSRGVRLPEVGTVAASALENELADRIPVEVTRTHLRIGKRTLPLTREDGSETHSVLAEEMGKLATQVRRKGKPARLLIRGEADLPYRYIDWILQSAAEQSITDIKLMGAYRGGQ